jgi:hypothetical protein
MPYLVKPRKPLSHTTNDLRTSLTLALLPTRCDALWPAFTPTTMLLCKLHFSSARLTTRLLPHLTWVWSWLEMMSIF